jgi:hypothetical protein
MKVQEGLPPVSDDPIATATDDAHIVGSVSVE